MNVGYNLRLSDPQASMGCIQLSKLKDFVRRRSKVANRFMENITNNSILSSNIKFQNTLNMQNLVGLDSSIISILVLQKYLA